MAGLWSTVFLTAWIFLRSRAPDVEVRPGAGELVPIALLAGLIQGAVIGGLQAGLLSRRIPGLAWAWTAASVLGAATTIGGGVFALTTYGWYYIPHPYTGVALCIGCVAVGCAQALVLARRTRWAAGWPVVKLAAVGAGIVACMLIGGGWGEIDRWSRNVQAAAPFVHLVRQSTEYLMVALVVIVPAVAYGLLTGLPLVALFDQGEGSRIGSPIAAPVSASRR